MRTQEGNGKGWDSPQGRLRREAEGRCGTEEAEQSVCFPSRKKPILENASGIFLCLEGLCRRRKGEREPSFKFPPGQFRRHRSVTHLQTLPSLDPPASSHPLCPAPHPPGRCHATPHTFGRLHLTFSLPASASHPTSTLLSGPVQAPLFEPRGPTARVTCLDLSPGAHLRLL